eukprot:341595-Chlamydomonas_euryale.AAC.2
MGRLGKKKAGQGQARLEHRSPRALHPTRGSALGKGCGRERGRLGNRPVGKSGGWKEAAALRAAFNVKDPAGGHTRETNLWAGTPSSLPSRLGFRAAPLARGSGQV